MEIHWTAELRRRGIILAIRPPRPRRRQQQFHSSHLQIDAELPSRLWLIGAN